MIDTGVYLPLRLFDSDGEMPELSTNRRECKGFAHGEYFWMPENYLLPFQVIDGSGTPIFIVDICTNETTALSITTETDSVEKATYVTFQGGSVSLPAGTYRLAVDSGEYSDPFIVGDVDGMVHLKYRGSVDTITDNIYWREGLFGECYINTVIEKPEYPIFEETREDQTGDQHKLFQRWDKRHTIRFFGVESMTDAMSMLPLMEYVEIDGKRVFDVEVEVLWEEERECLAEIVITFSHRKAIKTF